MLKEYLLCPIRWHFSLKHSILRSYKAIWSTLLLAYIQEGSANTLDPKDTLQYVQRGLYESLIFCMNQQISFLYSL